MQCLLYTYLPPIESSWLCRVDGSPIQSAWLHLTPFIFQLTSMLENGCHNKHSESCTKYTPVSLTATTLEDNVIMCGLLLSPILCFLFICSCIGLPGRFPSLCEAIQRPSELDGPSTSLMELRMLPALLPPVVLRCDFPDSLPLIDEADARCAQQSEFVECRREQPSRRLWKAAVTSRRLQRKSPRQQTFRYSTPSGCSSDSCCQLRIISTTS